MVFSVEVMEFVLMLCLVNMSMQHNVLYLTLIVWHNVHASEDSVELIVVSIVLHWSNGKVLA